MRAANLEHPTRGRARISFLALIAFALVLLAPAMKAPDARAGVPIEAFNAIPTDTQAGGHPDVLFSFALKNRYDQLVEEGLNDPCDCQDAKDITVHLPTGLIGNLPEPPVCTAAQFAGNQCPVDSQFGIAEASTTAFIGSGGEAAALPFIAAVYKLQPQPGQAGLIGFKIQPADIPVFTVLSARTGSDYGIDAKVSSIWHVYALHAFKQVLWGVNADPKNNPLRFPLGQTGRIYGLLCDSAGNPSTEDPNTIDKTGFFGNCNSPATPGVPSNSPEMPFWLNPSTCGVPLTSSIDVLSYDGEETHASASYPATTGCEKQSFDPSLAAQPTTEEADSPSGLDVQLKVPQFLSATVPSPSEIKETTVTLPEGFSINPAAAEGKTSCSDAAARFGSEEQGFCPEFSKVGTLEVHTSVLPGPLPGYVYLGDPKPGERFRLILVADGFGTHVKLPGTVAPDPQTGQLVASFKNLPQTPFQEFDLHFFGSEKGALATPTKCGTYPVVSRFVPWNGALEPQESTQLFKIEQGPDGKPCPGERRPFEPSFDAGSAGNSPAAHSTYSVDVKREDGYQFLSGLDVTTPTGFAADLSGVPYCPEAAIAMISNPLYSGLAELNASACPAASRIGSVAAGAGAGSKPLYVDGKVYLAGPYRGAPLSLVVVVPGVAGPYDLGNVVDRAAIHVDPVTARVTTVADPLPQILEGVPLRARRVQVSIDRENFALTGTNCSPHSTEARITGAEGVVSSQSAHYQLANCAGLRFGPKLNLRLTGGTKRGGHPALRAVLRSGPGEANLAAASVALPHSEFLDQGNIRTICTRVQYAAEQCPAAAIYGRAKAISPILAEPLEGPVYLRSSSQELPDLVMDLNGQVDFDAIAHIDSKNGGIRSTFDFIPDIPISKVVLSMRGGKKGLLENSRDICAGRTPRAIARLAGQNGRRSNSRVPLRASCGKRKASRMARKAG